MLSIGKITSADYYTTLSSGTYEDYLSGAGEAPGRWLGQGLTAFAEAARAAGIEVPESVKAGQTIDERGAEWLRWTISQASADTVFPPQRRPGRTQKDREKKENQAAQGKAGKAAGAYVAAYDLTFSAPKGVSIIAELTDNADLRATIHGCHDRAVNAAIAYAEQVACWGREGKDGVEVVPGSGFVAAAYRHRTSRPPEKGAIPDPQTHTHVLVANVVEHPDGTWGALDGRATYAWKMALGAMYRQALVCELEAADIHLPWKATRADRGLIEVDFPPDLLAAFSRRRDQIEEAADRLGLAGLGGMQAATLATRPPKTTDAACAPEAELPAMLRSRSDLAELSPDAQATLHTVAPGYSSRLSTPGGTLTDEELDAIAAELVREASTWAVTSPGTREPPMNHLTATQSTFRHHQVVAALAWRSMGTGTPPERIDAAATRLLEGSEAVAIDAPGWQRRWTTREILTLESRIIRMAEQGRGMGAGAVSEAQVSAVLAGNDWLSGEQKAMVRHVTTSGNAVDVVVGSAGSGKTAGLRAAKEAWDSAGIPVIGCAHAARAAQGLEDDSGIRSSTMASLLLALRNEESEGLPPGCVVVVDETSMTDTRPVAELAAYVSAAGGKLVLVGDHRQLQAVGAGGVYRALVEDSAITVQLLENRRQTAEWEKDILAQLREDEDGSGVRKAVEAWTEHGRLVMHDDLAGAYAACVRGWLADTDAGLATTMIAGRREDAAALSRLARAMLVERGEIEEGVGAGPDGLRFAAGDRVICLHNNTRIGVRNGNAGTVEEVVVSPRAGRVSLAVRLDHGELVTLSERYVAGGHVTYGHGTTGHKVQGATLDTAHVLGAGLASREAAYVAASRHREAVTIHAVDAAAAIRESTTGHGQELIPDATDAFVDQISGRSEEWAASSYGSGTAGIGPTTTGIGVTFSTRTSPDQARELFRQRAELVAEMTRQGRGNVQPATLARYDEVTRQLRYHAHQLGQEAVVVRPQHVVEAIGEPPILPGAEARWVTAAGAIQAYRERWEVEDEQALGTTRPADPIQAADRERVERVVESYIGVPEPVVEEEDEDEEGLVQQVG